MRRVHPFRQWKFQDGGPVVPAFSTSVGFSLPARDPDLEEFGRTEAEQRALAEISRQGQFPSLSRGSERPYYSPSLFGRASMENIDSRSDAIAELSHAVNRGDESIFSHLGRNLRLLGERFLHGDSGVYDTEGTLENTAHGTIEPSIRRVVNTADAQQFVERLQGPEGDKVFESLDREQGHTLARQLNKLGLLRGRDKSSNLRAYWRGVQNKSPGDVIKEMINNDSVKQFSPFSINRESGGPLQTKDNAMSANLYRRYRRYGIGGFLKNNAQAIGTGLGAGAGAFFGNPMLGAKIGGAAGGLAQGALQDDQQGQQQRRIDPALFDFGGTRGTMSFRSGGALKIQGRSHDQGGVKFGSNTEVEGGETIGGVQGQPHAFSDKLKVPGTDKTFAELHQDLIQRGASERRISNLANLQSKVAGRGGIGGTNLEEGGPYAVKSSETEGDEPKYPMETKQDVKDAWKLRNHGKGIQISQEKLNNRIKRRARKLGVDLPTDDSDSKQLGGPIDDGGFQNFIRRLHNQGIPNLGAAGENLVGDTLQDTTSNVKEAVRSNTGIGNRILRSADPTFTIGGKPSRPLPPTVSPRNRTIGVGNVDLSQSLNIDSPLPPSSSGSTQSSSGTNSQSGAAVEFSDPFALIESIIPSRAEGAGVESGTGSIDTSGFTPQTSNAVANAISAQGGSSAGESGESGSFGSNVDNLLPFLPGAINAARGIFGKAEGVDVPRLSIPRTAVNEARRLDTDINVRPQLASATRAFRSIAADPNASQAQKQSAFSRLMRTRSGIQAQEENKETNLRNQRQQLVSQLLGDIESREAQVNQRAGTREAISQNRAEAAKQNLIGTGISQLVGARQRQKATQRVEEARENARQAIQNRNIQGAIVALTGLPKSSKENVINALLPTITDEKIKQSLRDFLNNSQ